jgi:hypothetical protein
MTYKDNTPTFNANRKVVNYKDFIANKEDEKSELEEIERTNKPNMSDTQQFIGNKRYKYNKVTRKIEEISPDELEDRIRSLEEEK